MAEKKPTLELWSVAHGKMAKFECRIENGEIVAEYKGEVLKFPGGVTKERLMDFVDAHNKANKGVKAISKEDIKAQEDLDQANEKLLADL